MPYNTYKLVPGGRLLEIKENTEDEVVREITDIPTAHMLHDCTCKLDDDLILEDIFFYVNKNLDFWDVTLGNWCEIYTKSGLNPDIIEDEDSDWVTFDYLELQHSMGINKWNKDETRMEGSHILDFHGMGHYTKDDESCGTKEGETTRIGISFTPTNELARYPIRFEEEFDLFFHNYSNVEPIGDDEDFVERLNRKKPLWFRILDSICRWAREIKIPYAEQAFIRLHNFPRKIYTLKGSQPTLFEILYSIYWEMSWYGDPEETKERQEEIMGRLEDYKERKEE